MFSIQDKIKPWQGEQKKTGDIVYQRIVKHLDAILLSAYRTLDPSTTFVPKEVLATEHKKFDHISHGAFTPEYFAAQAKIIADVSRNADFVDYLTAGYAPYSAGLVSALVKETKWSGKQRDVLIRSLMNSVFSEASVVMFYYFDLLNKAAEDERSKAEAERARVAEEDARVIEILGDALSALANGDLSYQIREDIPAKSEPIRRNFNEALSRLQAAMGRVSASTSSIRAGTLEITSASDDLSRRSEQQAASLEETAAALNEITATVQSTAESAKHAREIVSTTKDEAEHSGAIMRQAEDAMSAIQASSQQISQIIGVIDEIAFQTNLLALNAGVEAARAGDAGKGFAVVAQEVRELAQRSAEAAKQIKGLISASEQQVGQGVNLVAQTGSALSRIVSRVAEINTIVADIDASSREQSTGIREINTAINQMDQFTQQNAAKVEETAAAGHHLSQEAEQLARLVSEFRVSSESAPMGRRDNISHFRNIA